MTPYLLAAAYTLTLIAAVLGFALTPSGVTAQILFCVIAAGFVASLLMGIFPTLFKRLAAGRVEEKR